MENKDIKFSVIIPCHAASPTIQKCLESIFSQTSARSIFEVIVVENGIKDTTEEIVKGFDAQYIYEKRAGRARARNIGASAAKGEFLAFIDADCFIPKNWLEEMSQPFEHNFIGATQCAFEPISKNGTNGLIFQYIYNQRKVLTRSSFESILREGILFPKLNSAALMVKKNIFRSLGGFDEEYKRFEDRLFGIDLLSNSYGIFCCVDLRVKEVVDNKSWMSIFHDNAQESYFSNKVFFREKRSIQETCGKMVRNIQLASKYRVRGHFLFGVDFYVRATSLLIVPFYHFLMSKFRQSKNLSTRKINIKLEFPPEYFETPENDFGKKRQVYLIKEAQFCLSEQVLVLYKGLTSVQLKDFLKDVWIKLLDGYDSLETLEEYYLKEHNMSSDEINPYLKKFFHILLELKIMRPKLK